jgi:hypothetical protein
MEFDYPRVPGGIVHNPVPPPYAVVAKLADTPDLGSGGVPRKGSCPVSVQIRPTTHPYVTLWGLEGNPLPALSFGVGFYT